jgi:hypothetical protein
VEDLPERTEKSYEAQDALDLNRNGLAELQRRGIRTAVVYIDPEPKVHPLWLTEMRASYQRLAAFEPNAKTKGPTIEIYRCPS